VRFVGTCTIGTDHLDLDYFSEAGIAWSSAPGCNARGVVDYVLGSLLVLGERLGAELAQRTYGVVGAGQVGERLIKVLRGLGCRVLVCDPPRQRAEGGDYVSLQQIIEQCDVISLHTPLTRDGEFATRHLLDADLLEQLRPGTWLLNASRGEVLDTAALCALLQRGADLHVVLDVWEGEPLVDLELAALCHIATPHIAGYSLEGKLRGTAQIYQAFCRAQGIEPIISLESLTPPRWLQRLSIAAGSDPDWTLGTVCRAIYDPRRDDADLRRSLVVDEQARKAGFDLLRKRYPVRREIEGLEVELLGSDEPLSALISALGARVISVK